MSLTVARRYAQALYQDALQKNCVDRVDEDVLMVQESIDGSPELARFFQDPILTADKKISVVDALFTDRVHDVTHALLKLLVEKGREGLFMQVAEAYRAMRDKQQGIVEAQVRAALPLSAEDQQKITTGIEAMTGKKVRLNATVDPKILGGLIIRVGDTVYDGSVLHQLGTLRGRLEQSTIGVN